MSTGNRSLQQPYDLEDQIGFILRKANQRHLAIFSERLPAVTPTQFASLAKLAEHGPLSQAELGRRTAMDGATIKGVIDRLRERELVSTVPDEKDRRRLVVRLTEAGQSFFQLAIRDALLISRETLAPLSHEERESFLELLRKIT